MQPAGSQFPPSQTELRAMAVKAQSLNHEATKDHRQLFFNSFIEI